MDSTANRLWKKDGERAKKEGRWGGQQLANSQPDYKTSYKTKATSTNDQLARPYTTDELCHSISLSPAYPSVSRFSSIDFFKVRPAGPEHARLNKRCLLAEFGNFFPSPRFFYSPFFFLLLFHLLFFCPSSVVLIRFFLFNISWPVITERMKYSTWPLAQLENFSFPFFVAMYRLFQNIILMRSWRRGCTSEKEKGNVDKRIYTGRCIMLEGIDCFAGILRF